MGIIRSQYKDPGINQSGFHEHVLRVLNAAQIFFLTDAKTWDSYITIFPTTILVGIFLDFFQPPNKQT